VGPSTSDFPKEYVGTSLEYHSEEVLPFVESNKFTEGGLARSAT
jgi:hypothetical protein